MRTEPTFEPVLNYIAVKMREEGATEGEIASRQVAWVMLPASEYERAAYTRGFEDALSRPIARTDGGSS